MARRRVYSLGSAVAMTDAKSWPHWTTPDHVLELVRRVGPITVDPCSNYASKTNAFVSADGVNLDGLRLRWHQYIAASGGICFLNPPYSARVIDLWMAKAHEEAQNGAPIIALIPTAMCAGWMHDHVLSVASAVCCPRGRIRFDNAPPGVSNRAPRHQTALFSYGKIGPSFMEAFAELGAVFDMTTTRGAARALRVA